MADKSKEALFFPYYVNQPRLFDVYAILNDGFSEYEEVETRGSSEKSGNAKAKAGLAGFKFFKVGIDAEAELSGELSSTKSSGVSSRKVQTPTSMLGLVLRELRSRKYIHEIEGAQEGDFVVVPVSLQINSVKAVINEAVELTELGKKMQALGSAAKPRQGQDQAKKLKDIAAVTKELFDAEEFVSQTDDYAVIGNLSDANLYQANRADLVGTGLTCLGQVRCVYPEGARLMRNTVFSKFGATADKKALLDSLASITEGGQFEYEAVAIPEINGKPVYELEVVALYQEAHSADWAGLLQP